MLVDGKQVKGNQQVDVATNAQTFAVIGPQSCRSNAALNAGEYVALGVDTQSARPQYVGKNVNDC